VSPQRKAALLSVGAGLLTLFLKFGAYFLTGSVGLLSDATESLVNLTAAVVAFAAISIAARPPDVSHPYGHEKAEYFSSGLEGGLILAAAAGIVYAAGLRLLHPAPLHHVDVGLAIALAASLVNLGVARVLLRIGRQVDSIALVADSQHLMTDVWTSVGVVVGVGLAGLTGWYVLDPLIAIGVAVHIVLVGIELVRRSIGGLMDRALPDEEIAIIRQILADEAGEATPYHGLRTRKSGPRRFIDLHLLVAGTLTVKEAHDLAERIEHRLETQWPGSVVTIHVEPVEDLASWDAEEVGGLSGPEIT